MGEMTSFMTHWAKRHRKSGKWRILRAIYELSVSRCTRELTDVCGVWFTKVLKGSDTSGPEKRVEVKW